MVEGGLFTIIFIFNFLTCRKALETLYIEQLLNNYSNLLPEMPKYCFPVQFFMCFLVIFQGMKEMWSYLLRRPNGGKSCKMLSHRHKRMARVGFERQPCRSPPPSSRGSGHAADQCARFIQLDTNRRGQKKSFLGHNINLFLLHHQGLLCQCQHGC